MSLPVAMRAHQHGNIPRRVHPHRRRVIQTDPCTQHSHQIGRRNPARLDPCRKPKTTQLAVRFRLCRTPLKPRQIANINQLIQRRVIVARVVHKAHWRRVRVLIRLDKVLAPDFHRVDPQFMRCLVHHPFN